MNRHDALALTIAVLMAGLGFGVVGSAMAAEVTADRLNNPDNEPQKLLAANRGAALWGNFVISVANYPARVIATDKETGKVAWETNMGEGQPELALSAAPLPVKDKIVIGAAGGDRGVRDFIAALDGA